MTKLTGDSVCHLHFMDNHSFRHWVANWIAKSKRKRNEIDRMTHMDGGKVGLEHFRWKLIELYNIWHN